MLQHSQRAFHTGMGPHVSCVHLWFPHCLLNRPSLLSRSSQQVPRSCGLAQPSLEAGLAHKVYVGHRKRKRALSNTLEILRNSLRCSQTLKRIYLSRHNDTAQHSGSLSGVVGWDFRKRHKPRKKSKALILGGLVWTFSSSTVQKVSPFLSNSPIFKPNWGSWLANTLQSHTSVAESWK